MHAEDRAHKTVEATHADTLQKKGKLGTHHRQQVSFSGQDVIVDKMRCGITECQVQVLDCF